MGSWCAYEAGVVTLMPDTLTQRETEVLGLIGKAKTSKQIALALNLSVHTVGNHRKHICRKLGLHTTAELVAFAIQQERSHNAAAS